jgi:hypothetical protein
MESPKRISKAQLLEMVRREVDFQEKRKLLESKISELNEEIYFITEGVSGKKSKKEDEDEIDEGLFQNMGRAISRGVSGIGQAAQGIKQNYQQGADQKGLEHITSDINQKEQELAQLKKDFQFKTGKPYSADNIQNPTALARDKQGVIKKAVPPPPIPASMQGNKKAVPPPPIPASMQGNKKAMTPPPVVKTPPKVMTPPPVVKTPPKVMTPPPVPTKKATKKPVAKKQTANVIPAKKQGKKVAQ